MIRSFLLLLPALLLLSCSSTKSGGKVCYKNTRTTLGIQWREKMVVLNSLNLKRGNYFEYYQQFPTPLPGINTSKLVEYKGSYTQSGDTIRFHFCGDTIPRPMTGEVLIDTARKRIVFLSVNPRLSPPYEISKKNDSHRKPF